MLSSALTKRVNINSRVLSRVLVASTGTPSSWSLNCGTPSALRSDKALTKWPIQTCKGSSQFFSTQAPLREDYLSSESEDEFSTTDWNGQAAATGGVEDDTTTTASTLLAGGLPSEVLDVLRTEKGITEFTACQLEAFDPVLNGKDVIVRSRTGTGKTLAFGMPSLMRLTRLLEEKGVRDPSTGKMRRGRPVSMLVLCPTRELARQVQGELSIAAKPLKLDVQVFHGGVRYEPQAQAIDKGIDVLVGTPGRIMDHLDRGNLRLNHCEIVVLDEADEMLNMGFAADVEYILKGLGSDIGTSSGSRNGATLPRKPQCLLFSATTPRWVKDIAAQYQQPRQNVVSIDATGNEGGARVAKTVRHIAVKLPPPGGLEAIKNVLEDIIAVEISKDIDSISQENVGTNEPKVSSANATQQQIFGKSIVFVHTKRDANDLVSGSVFKSLSAQALHGDVGQKQRDATLDAFRSGAFNVLVATDVAARGIDIRDVDLVVQVGPPRATDAYVHRSGRTGRAGRRGVSVLLYSSKLEERDVVRIERELGHGFAFELSAPPTTEAALHAAAKTSAVASLSIPTETAEYFRDAAKALLETDKDPVAVVARCLASVSRRSAEVLSRSLLTGEVGWVTLKMSHPGSRLQSHDVFSIVTKLSRDIRNYEDYKDLTFDVVIGKIQVNSAQDAAFLDMPAENAKKLIELSKAVDTGGVEFSILREMEVVRDKDFGSFAATRQSQRGRPFGGGDRRGHRGRSFNRERSYNSRPRKNNFGRGRSSFN